MSEPPLLALERVGKAYGRVTALVDVDLAVERGEVVALVGPNGAGKSTAVALAVGLRRPDSGRALLLGRDPRDPGARAGAGLTPQATGFPPTLRVSELLELVRAHFPEPAPAAELLERFGLADVERRQVGGLSGGQQRRLAVALAFAGRPRLVVLDEPTTGLDVETRHAVWAEVARFAAEGGSVLLTTHQFDEAEALAGRAVVVAGGRVLADATIAEIRRRATLGRVRIAGDGVPDVAGVVSRRHGDGETVLLVRDAGEVVAALVRAGVELRGLEVRGATLEEAFLEIVRRG